jgi:sec-independent protein translocase protein TatB
VFDIGIGELIILGALGLLVFGPERLPRAAADAGKWIRQIRQMATNAKNDLADSAGIDLTETMDAVKGLTDLHPRKIATSLMADEPQPKSKGTQPAAAPDQPRPAFDPDAT